MNGRMMTTLLLFVAASAALATGANAQEAAAPAGGMTQPASVATIGSGAEPNQFGTNWAIKVIPASEFTPLTSSELWSMDGSWLTSNYNSDYYAALDLPAGSEVSQVCLFTYDNNATLDISMTWRAVGMSTGQDSYTEVATAATSGAPGKTLICATPAAPVTIRAYGDIDGDGDLEYGFHNVNVYSGGTSNLRFGALIVHWRHAISPAPATATFPNDVPTTHPFFQYIEALGASGITAGCGTGSFCPDSQVTRAEMAVFLTKALGLYWPQ